MRSDLVYSGLTCVQRQIIKCHQTGLEMAWNWTVFRLSPFDPFSTSWTTALFCMFFIHMFNGFCGWMHVKFNYSTDPSYPKCWVSCFLIGLSCACATRKGPCFSRSTVRLRIPLDLVSTRLNVKTSKEKKVEISLANAHRLNGLAKISMQKADALDRCLLNT